MLLHLGHHRMIIMMPLSLELSKYKLVLCLAKQVGPGQQISTSCQSLIMSTVRTSALAYSIECCMFIYKTQTSRKCNARALTGDRVWRYHGGAEVVSCGT